MAARQPAGIDKDMLEQAREQLAELPDGTYTLEDIATRWPDLLPSAMQLCGEAMAKPRQSTFHSTSGVVRLERAPSRNSAPLVEHRRGDDVVFRIHSGTSPKVSLGRPFRRGQ